MLGSCKSVLKKSKHKHTTGNKAINGTNELFRAISNENWQEVIRICAEKPYKASVWHSVPAFFNGESDRPCKLLPLHKACVFRPPQMAIESLIRAYPEALSEKESAYDRVPLHLACQYSPDFDVIQVLLMKRPAACLEKDIIGRVPLHYALNNCADKIIVRELLVSANEMGGMKALSQCISTADYKGWTPLHIACNTCVPIDIIRLLVQVYPNGVNEQTERGTTPIAMVRKLSIPEPKRLLMEAVLEGTEVDPPIDNLKRNPEDSKISTLIEGNRQMLLS